MVEELSDSVNIWQRSVKSLERHVVLRFMVLQAFENNDTNDHNNDTKDYNNDTTDYNNNTNIRIFVQYCNICTILIIIKNNNTISIAP